MSGKAISPSSLTARSQTSLPVVIGIFHRAVGELNVPNLIASEVEHLEIDLTSEAEMQVTGGVINEAPTTSLSVINSCSIANASMGA